MSDRTSGRSKSKAALEELTQDIKNDLQWAFDIFKNNKNKIDKVCLRTILYSFVLYKSSPKDINDFISEHFPKQNEFVFEELTRLVHLKLKVAREKESEDLAVFITNEKYQSAITKGELEKAYESIGFEVSQREIEEMMMYINNDSITNFEDKKFKPVDSITKEELKRFYMNNK